MSDREFTEGKYEEVTALGARLDGAIAAIQKRIDELPEAPAAGSSRTWAEQRSDRHRELLRLMAKKAGLRVARSYVAEREREIRAELDEDERLSR